MKYQLDNSKIDSVPCVALYRPDKDHYSPSIIACFMINDGWNEQALLALKEKAEADILVGLQTDEHKYERLDIIEGVVRCQPGEINDVIALLNVNSASTIIGIDVIDVINLFEVGSSFQFVQASSTGEHEFDMIKTATYKMIGLLTNARNTKGVLIGTQSVQSLPLEAFAYISDAIEGLLSNDNAFTYLSSSMTDEPNCFRLKAVYAEEK
ncbi:hypothetical protein [Psychrobacter sp. Rd 27.2]|uniref:hypothetical protein n=1 Tax=Psychrobacter TaxID=497 RepID=UPI000946D618|nr:hypothetical protein [Psychrobacter sp. Rd 27.2]OLF41620.1 hypothetical protein BTV99_03720 [Psychrobacter sp. Rd 27.2]